MELLFKDHVSSCWHAKTIWPGVIRLCLMVRRNADSCRVTPAWLWFTGSGAQAEPWIPMGTRRVHVAKRSPTLSAVIGVCRPLLIPLLSMIFSDMLYVTKIKTRNLYGGSVYLACTEGRFKICWRWRKTNRQASFIYTLKVSGGKNRIEYKTFIPNIYICNMQYQAGLNLRGFLCLARQAHNS